MKEQFMVTDFAGNYIFTSDQNEQYILQMDENIDFLREMTKESEKVNNSLHTQVSKMDAQNKKLDN